MRYFEDLQVGEKMSCGGIVIDEAEAAEFARRYDPKYVPRPGVGHIHGGPEISPWLTAALSWKMLADLAATDPVEEADFSRPGDIQWGTWTAGATDTLRVEAEIVELLPPSARLRQQGWARVKVTVIRNGPAGFGSWGDDDSELVDDVVLTYSATLTARRREETSIYYGIG